jgi:hypothetical protein
MTAASPFILEPRETIFVFARIGEIDVDTAASENPTTIGLEVRETARPP